MPPVKIDDRLGPRRRSEQVGHGSFHSVVERAVDLLDRLRRRFGSILPTGTPTCSAITKDPYAAQLSLIRRERDVRRFAVGVVAIWLVAVSIEAFVIPPGTRIEIGLLGLIVVLAVSVAAGVGGVLTGLALDDFLATPREFSSPARLVVPLIVLGVLVHAPLVDAVRLYLVDPFADAVWPESGFGVFVTRPAADGMGPPYRDERVVSPRQMLTSHDHHPEGKCETYVLTLDTLAVFDVLKPGSTERYERLAARGPHSYDVAIVLRLLATAGVVTVFWLAGAVPRWLAGLASVYLILLTVAMMHSRVVLGFGHPVFWVGYVAVPLIALAIYLVRVSRLAHRSVHALLGPRLPINPAHRDSLDAAYRSHLARPQRLEAAIIHHLETFNAAFSGAAWSVHSRPLWRLLFGSLFHPQLRHRAEALLVDRQALTAADFRNRELFERFAEAEVLAAATARNATEAENDPMATQPLSECAMTPEIVSEPGTQDFLTIITGGDIHGLADELVQAQLREFAEVRHRPLAFWRRILRLPPPTLPLHEQVREILRQLKGIIDDAAGVVESHAGLLKKHREAVIAAKTANLDFEVEEAKKRADAEEQRARRAEAGQRRRQAEGEAVTDPERTAHDQALRERQRARALLVEDLEIEKIREQLRCLQPAPELEDEDPFLRSARTMQRVIDTLPDGDPTQQQYIHGLAALRAHQSLTKVRAAFADEWDNVKAILEGCGIRTD